MAQSGSPAPGSELKLWGLLCLLLGLLELRGSQAAGMGLPLQWLSLRLQEALQEWSDLLEALQAQPWAPVFLSLGTLVQTT